MSFTSYLIVDYYHELDKYKDMLYYFGCIYFSFKDLTDIEKWIFIFNSKDLQAIKLFLSRFVGKAFQARNLYLENC